VEEGVSVAFGSVGGGRWDEEQARDAPATRGKRDFGFWMLDAGCWMLDAGCWMEEEEQARGGMRRVRFSAAEASGGGDDSGRGKSGSRPAIAAGGF
jgi:hypothetical protein